MYLIKRMVVMLISTKYSRALHPTLESLVNTTTTATKT